jgi:hypothetical protein
MKLASERGSGDTLFTIFFALGAAAITLVFIAAGSMVARVTFTPHHASEASTSH